MMVKRTMEFVLDDFSELESELGYMPRSVLMTISMNPYTGNVVVATQHSDACRKVLSRVFAQIKRIRAPKVKAPKVLRLFEEVA